MAVIEMEREEIAIRVISVGYALGIVGLILRLQDEDISECMHALLCSALPKEKKKPDIAVSKDKTPPRTQAQILAEQRERVRNLHGVADKKLKVKSPKRKQPPHLDKKQ
ncbi:hypothetical protein P43SY_001309 [Pythium insidiosum]|uniref:Uncharacterized protein n=1 Tax=Pythium insidiosum TaxID=114742 RepID=A0AAD5Q6P6_PYTIN|nr:hypothetical protein P43SY_001309 [Pythium insidiosum]